MSFGNSATFIAITGDNGFNSTLMVAKVLKKCQSTKCQNVSCTLNKNAFQ